MVKFEGFKLGLRQNGANCSVLFSVVTGAFQSVVHTINICKVMVSSKMNAVRLLDGMLQPLRSFLRIITGIVELIEKISEEYYRVRVFKMTRDFLGHLN